MAKKYVPAATVEECKEACKAGLLHWESHKGVWWRMLYPQEYFENDVSWESLMHHHNASILVDTDEDG